MTFAFLGPDPLEVQLDATLIRLAAGEPPCDIEAAAVDVKEEPGRRGSGGAVRPGRSENDDAARYLADEMACFANTPGGGAIILGISDDGIRIGTELDREWLRHRIWELTGGRLTVAIREARLDGHRLLVLSTHEAIEPIRRQKDGRITWRVDDNCVEVDPTTWHSGRLTRTGVDWSLQPSGHLVPDASPLAIELARRYLRADTGSGDTVEDITGASDADLLRRLNVVTPDGHLTNAGSLLFVATPHPGVDYIRRDVPGGDSVQRVLGTGPLIEQIHEVERLSQAHNRLIHAPSGFAHGQSRAIPERAMREAVVNGLVHRDWLSSEPTLVEHVGDMVTVTSPGGFVGGVSPDNIITHPASPRYRALAEVVAALRLSEREGVGVDRMYRDMLAIGRRAPAIGQIPGPHVRVTLVGGDADPAVLELLRDIAPARSANDVDVLLLLSLLDESGWIDVERAAPVLQRDVLETEAAIERLQAARVAGAPLIVTIRGVPADAPAAYRLTGAVRERLSVGSSDPVARERIILGWARSRGRVSSTEVADLTGISVPYAGKVLTRLEDAGKLAAGRTERRGRGFFYVLPPTDEGTADGRMG